MRDFQEILDEHFIEKLDYTFVGQALPKPEMDGIDNIENYEIAYEARGIRIIVVECHDRIVEFQKRLIKQEKKHYPHAHFLFVSNGGKVFDLYNDCTSKKLKKLTYDEIGRNTRLFKEKLELFDVTGAEDGTQLQINVERAFEVNDKVTKNFFDKFQKIHDRLKKSIQGIEDEKDRSWYASVMMNRLMFIYFLQKQKVIQGDTDFLLNKFLEVKSNGRDYYRDFLLPLFFYGFARKDENPHKQEFVKKYGPIRYLNGGLFYPHHLEKKYQREDALAPPFGDAAMQTTISIDAKEIEKVLNFLNGYTWYLDSRPVKNEDEINPDVLGFIFEKYINDQESLGAYYTKEDITEYISKSTIIPFIFDKMRRSGFDAPDPTPLITENADFIGIMDSYVEGITDYAQLKFLYKDVLLPLSVLDPSVGSGAFLFAALRILLPIYQKCVFGLRQMAPKQSDPWLKELLDTLGRHAEEYYLTKQVILNNLYGVDIVEEATEICKLRLFLQLASHLPDIESIEPLPDIDFNIYAGNSLVGGLSWEDLEKNYLELFGSDAQAVDRGILQEQISQLTEQKRAYRQAQQQEDEENPMQIKGSIAFLQQQINNGISLTIENPFHWFADFHGILENGGFDVIIGNPPYVEYSKIRSSYELSWYKTVKSGNLYAFFIERAQAVISNHGRLSYIVPISFSCTKRMASAQDVLLNSSRNVWFSHFAERPGKLFEGAEVLLNIFLSEIQKHKKNPNCSIYSTGFLKWKSEDRGLLFDSIKYLSTARFRNYLIPKFQDGIEANIWDKIHKYAPLQMDLVKQSENRIYYRIGGGRYWKVFTNFQPYFAKEGKREASSRENHMYTKSEKDTLTIIGVLSSTLFYWYFINSTNCRDLNPYDLNSFPIGVASIDNSLKDGLSEVVSRLMASYQENSRLNEKKNGVCQQEFIVNKSKSILDEVDSLLAQHYGFTDDELRFIVGYDSKFRLSE